MKQHVIVTVNTGKKTHLVESIITEQGKSRTKRTECGSFKWGDHENHRRTGLELKEENITCSKCRALFQKLQAEQPAAEPEKLIAGMELTISKEEMAAMSKTLMKIGGPRR